MDGRPKIKDREKKKFKRFRTQPTFLLFFLYPKWSKKRTTRVGLEKRVLTSRRFFTSVTSSDEVSNWIKHFKGTLCAFRNSVLEAAVDMIAAMHPRGGKGM